jgi:hypothetical protein
VVKKLFTKILCPPSALADLSAKSPRLRYTQDAQRKTRVSASLQIRTTKLALWTKAKVCDKACFESKIRREHQAGWSTFVLFVACYKTV